MKWKDVKEKRPKACEDILFTDGEKVYKGWLETWEIEEELMFYNVQGSNNDQPYWPENITHWMPLPKPRS